MVWRRLIHPRSDAVWNMAVDEAIMRSIQIGDAPRTLRLYQWEEQAISLGRFQNLDRTVRRSQVTDRSIPLVRRITGGGYSPRR